MWKMINDENPYITVTMIKDMKLFATTRPDTAPFHKCTKDGIDVKVYSDNKSPQCSSCCTKHICIKRNGKQATAIIKAETKYVNWSLCC